MAPSPRAPGPDPRSGMLLWAKLVKFSADFHGLKEFICFPLFPVPGLMSWCAKQLGSH